MNINRTKKQRDGFAKLNQVQALSDAAALGVKQLTKEDVQRICGIAPDAVNKWLKAGAPSRRVNRRVLFDPEQLAAWVSKRKGGARHAREIRSSQTPQEPAKDKPPIEDVTRNAVESARHIEAQALRACEEDAGAGGTDLREHYLKCSDNRRKWEKDWAEIQLSQAGSLSRDEVLADVTRIGAEFKQNLLSLPNALAPQLYGKTRVEISKTLTDRIEDALRKTSAALRGMAKE